ncbi:AraC family transcriptional regulator [Mucilaginibacter kameinonensis]|uniref:AraC family transcriptional regulator n=1 Tax=Mucilaginibacter kameinonensis TaxID=452286 RepID=UPI000EF8431B|nr:AraC family transcriptional regulator [Mucilaginibacter kameinonensis]
MERYRQFEPVLISDFETGKWSHPEHNHNHYELIYIKKGTGSHIINRLSVSYNAGDVFLLGPEESHYFEIEETTRFIYLKFTDLYIHQAGNKTSNGAQNLEYLIKSRETHLSGFALNNADRHTIEMIFNVIVSLKHDMFLNEQLIWMQIIALSAVLQRNMPELKKPANGSKDMQAIFCYIHKHIYEPRLLKLPVMAASFNIAGEYMGPYFKRNTGVTLRDYIRDYRNELIKQRIASGRYNLKQIAAEFGLTDESHVSKIVHKAL